MYAGVVTIHATAMTAALVLMVLGEVLLIPARLGQLASLRLALLTTRAVGVLIPVGLLAGIGVVILGGWPLLTPWLLCSFAMIGLLIVVDGRMVSPWTANLRSLPIDAGGGTSAQALVRDNRALLARLASITLFALIFAMMSTKPELAWPF